MRTTAPSSAPAPARLADPARRAARRRRARLAAGAAGAGLVLAVGAAPAAAHVEAAPTSVEAGSLATVSLGWHHGCAGSPTRQVSVRLPAGAAEVRLLAPEGWDAAGPDAAGVATFTARLGAEIVDGAEGSVGIELRVPDGADGRLVLPTVQTCVAGEEPWIEEPVGDEEPDKPAPVVEVVGGTGAGTPAAGHETEDDEHSTTTVQTAPPTTTTEAGVAVDGEAAAADEDDDDGGSTPLVVGAGLGIAAGVAAGLVLQRRRRAR
jgi:uncharacterized protein YcnI